MLHPKGDLWLNWRIEGETLRLEYKVPDGLPVVITPCGRLATYNLLVTALE